MRTCRICECTEDTPCVNDEIGVACSWVAEDLCDFCAIVMQYFLDRADEAAVEPAVELFTMGQADAFLNARAAGGGNG